MNRLGRILTLTVVALAAGAQPLHAADMPAKAPPLVAPPAAGPAVNWTGVYFGGEIGAIAADTTYSRPLLGLNEISIGSISSRPTYGMYGGFNYQVLPWAVLGIEGSGTWFSDTYYRELGGQFDFLQKSRRVGSVTGRVGVLLEPGTMVYGKVGPAWMEVEGFQNFGMPFEQTLQAVQAGVGVEALVTPNFAVRGEASYTYATSMLLLNQGFDQYRPHFLMLQLGAAYKFDAPAGWGAPQTVAAASPVAALPFKAPPLPVVAPGTPWTGLEAGGFVSANANMVRFNDTLLGDMGPYTKTVFGGGGFVGGNLQVQRVVFGVEASGNFEKANLDTAAGAGGFAGPTFYHFANIDRVLAVTGRVGVLATPDTLFYAKAGPAWLRMTSDANFFNALAPNIAGSNTFPGYTAGLGVETYLWPHVSLRVEGMYTHTGDTVVFNGVVPNEFTLQPSMLSGTIGLALHL